MSQLLEITFSDAHTVDRDAGVIRGVKVLGRQSRNGREYSDHALHDAARLYEGIGVNLNHAHSREGSQARSVEAGFGWLAGVAVRPDGVFGDLHYFKSHLQAAVIVEAAERNPRRFGLSHNAEGRVAHAGGKNVVESIEHVRSVDLVQNPATNAGLFESEESLMSTLTTRSIRQILTETHDGRLASLLDDDQLAPFAEAAVGFAADAGPDDQVAAAFKTMIDSVLDDDSLDLQAKLAKIRGILKAQAKLVGEKSSGNQPTGDGDGATGAVPPVAESAQAAASSDPLVRQLIERLDRIETQAACRELLETHHRACDGTRLKALAALTSADERVRLIESWPESVGFSLSSGRSPRPTISRPLVDADPVALPKDAKALAAALR
jgi:hypothetical protein